MKLNFTKLQGQGNFYFIRHGQSIWNIDKKVQGRNDVPLTEKGEEQARATGVWLKDKDITHIATSPLYRCRQTAAIIGNEIGAIPIESRQELLEVDTSIFSGHSLEEVAVLYPEQWENFMRYSWEGVDGAEKIDSLKKRCIVHWQYLMDLFKQGNQNIVSITHAGCLQWLIKVTLGSADSWMPLFSARNCGVYRLAVSNIPFGKKSSINSGESSPIPQFYLAWDMMDLNPCG